MGLARCPGRRGASRLSVIHFCCRTEQCESDYQSEDPASGYPRFENTFTVPLGVVENMHSGSRGVSLCRPLRKIGYSFVHPGTLRDSLAPKTAIVDFVFVRDDRTIKRHPGTSASEMAGACIAAVLLDFRR